MLKRTSLTGSRFRRGVAEAAILLALAFVMALLAAGFHPKRPSWNLAKGEISVAEARRTGRHILWIDARSKSEYDAARIEGALLLNEDDWNDLLPPVFAAPTPEGTLTIVYCGRATCDASRAVAQRLREELELEDVFVLKGGWEAWNAAK